MWVVLTSGFDWIFLSVYCARVYCVSNQLIFFFFNVYLKFFFLFDLF